MLNSRGTYSGRALTHIAEDKRELRRWESHNAVQGVRWEADEQRELWRWVSHELDSIERDLKIASEIDRAPTRSCGIRTYSERELQRYEQRELQRWDPKSTQRRGRRTIREMDDECELVCTSPALTGAEEEFELQKWEPKQAALGAEGEDVFQVKISRQTCQTCRKYFSDLQDKSFMNLLKLMKQFPSATEIEVRHALKHAGGHGGQAAKTLARIID